MQLKELKVSEMFLYKHQCYMKVNFMNTILGNKINCVELDTGRLCYILPSVEIVISKNWDAF